MTSPQLTPEQSARLDRLSRRWFWCAVYVAAVAWLLFAAAIWFASWRWAGLGALVGVLSAVCLVAALALRHEPGRQGAARNLNSARRKGEA